MQITSETELDEFKRFSVSRRGSEVRRHELERIANFCVPSHIRVTVRLDPTRALCRPGGEPYTYEVLIPTKQYGDAPDGLTQREWDRRMQVALLFHELGHVLHSGFGALGSQIEEIEPRWRDVFRRLYNAAEDVIVDIIVSDQFNVEREIESLNHRLDGLAAAHHREYNELFHSTENTDVTVEYTLYEAIRRGILDKGVGENSRFERLQDGSDDAHVMFNGRRDLLEEVSPTIQSYVESMAKTSDPGSRVGVAYRWFCEFREVLESVPPLQAERVQTAVIRPEDAAGYSSWHPFRVRPLTPDTDVEEVDVTDHSASLVPVTYAVPKRKPKAKQATEADWTAAARSNRRRGSQIKTSEHRSALEEEGRAIYEFVTQEDTSVSEVRIPEPVDETAVQSRFERVQRSVRPVEEALRSKLRRERRPSRRRGTKAGRLDSRRVVGATQGQDRVFSRIDSGHDRDYSCLIVLDRSGSMGNSPGSSIFSDDDSTDEQIMQVEEAATGLTVALSNVGVSTGVISIWRDTVCLEHPFDGVPKQSVGRLLSARVGGKTPLSDAVAVARNRIRHGSGKDSFIIVITDGDPDDEEAYQDEVERCSVPVYGLYLGDRNAGHASLFNRMEHTSFNSVQQDLHSIARRLFGDGQ